MFKDQRFLQSGFYEEAGDFPSSIFRLPRVLVVKAPLFRLLYPQYSSSFPRTSRLLSTDMPSSRRFSLAIFAYVSVWP
jgi:hypothetical protein